MTARRLARAAAVIAAACVALHARAADDGPYASGSLAWIFSDRLDLVGTMAAEIPLGETADWRVFLGARAMTAIEKASNFTFLVDRVSYVAEVGARRALDGHRGAVEVFAGEQGRQNVDAPGRARARVVGASWETDEFRRAFGSDGWSGRVALGAVLEDVGVNAIATTDGGVRWMRHVGRDGRVSAGFDLAWDALLGRDHGADILAGPRVDFDLGGDRRFGLYARWLQGGNPLGLDTNGLLLGFDLAQGPRGIGARAAPPEFSGFVAAGAGDGGRGLARLDIRVQSPAFLHGTYVEIEVDGNALAAADLSDLFYKYDVGVAHPVGDWRAGAWFYHRSNHVVDHENATVTSVNVLEAGIDSAGWNRAEPGVSLGRAGAIDARLRLGWIADSTFGHDVAWNARVGGRWASPLWGGVRLYVSAELDRGDVEASVYGAGLLLPRGWDVRLETFHDEQLFSSDQRGTLAVATLRF